MLRLIHSSAGRPTDLGNLGFSSYFSDIRTPAPTALTRFFTYSTKNSHVRLVMGTERWKAYQQEFPDSPKHYVEMGEDPVRPVRMISLSIETALDRTRVQSSSYGLTAEITQHSAVPLFYEVHFTIADKTKLQQAILRTDDPIRLELLQVASIESLLKDATYKIMFAGATKIAK